jgi:uncharacterized protein YecE (DUF72 family)
VEQLPLLPDSSPHSARPVAPIALASGNVWIGTCGYSYRDWIGPFYPPGTKSPQMLDRYAQRFPAVEIDSSYYRIPSAATFESMDRRTPSGFRFTAKLPGTLTHIAADAPETPLDDAALFRENITPLVDAGKLRVVLLQFPNSFRPGVRAERHLERLREALADLSLVAEFRHKDWQSNATLELLAGLEIGWCNVDEPRFKSLLRPSSDVVGNVAYVRLHGRNAKTWWKGDAAERYMYSYTPDELEPWAARVGEMSAAALDTYVFFNNHRFGHAASNASMFAEMLRRD